MIARIVSGGQSGVDRAALDAALELGIDCGGWCPRGRKAEDGTIPSRYPLIETTSDDYSDRTQRNVRDSDGTLILAWGKPSGGTLLTVAECRKLRKPYLVLDLSSSQTEKTGIESARRWISENLPGGVLNVAGPRASADPAVYERAKSFMTALLRAPAIEGERGA